MLEFIKPIWSNLSICKDRILSAYSRDGKSWIRDSGIRIDVSRTPEFCEDMVYGCWVGEDGTGYRMIYQGSKFNDGIWSSSLIERRSVDGLNWCAGQPTGVQSSSHPLCMRRVQSPTLCNINESYILYFSGTDANGVTRILAAEQNSGGAWTVCNDPMLIPEQFLSREDQKITGLMDPSVVATGDGRWRMYLSASLNGSSFLHIIVSALSGDGRCWFPDPGVRVANNFNGRKETANNPTVVRLGSGYRMWFRGSDIMPLNSHIYFADSMDGLEWEVKGLALKLRRWHPYERHGIGFPFVLKKHDDTLRMYYTAYWGNWRCGETVKNYESSYLSRNTNVRNGVG